MPVGAMSPKARTFDPDTSAELWLDMLIRAFYADLWGAGDVATGADVLHPDLRFRGSIGQEHHGINGFWSYADYVRGALGGYHCEILSLVCQDTRAAAKMRFSGRHRDDFMGVAPTGREIAWHGAAFFEMHEAKLRDIWVLGDTDGLRRALGGEP